MINGVSCAQSTPGIIYLGRVPHGFYEHEMRSYFSQFGTVTRLRLSRNKKTGHSKHYAFIEFSDDEVAQIVADTMNNYLLFGHILKCKVVPRGNIEYVEQLFKGANKRYKARPTAKIAKALMEKKKPEEAWAKKIDAENQKRKLINSRLRAKGIEYEFEAPVAKKADRLEAKATQPVVEALAVEEKAVDIAEEPKVEEPVVVKKTTRKRERVYSRRVFGAKAAQDKVVKKVVVEEEKLKEKAAEEEKPAEEEKVAKKAAKEKKAPKEKAPKEKAAKKASAKKAAKKA